jgi:hypothetical protein
MARGRLTLLALGIVLFARGAAAEESRFSDRFFRGTSPGELPAAKVAVVGALYVGAVASLSIGVASLVQAGQKGNEADGFKHDQAPGFCTDLASPACAGYRGLLDEERATRNVGWILLGSGGLLALGGALTAELWQNDAAPQVAVGVGPGTLTLGLSGKF